MCLSRRLGSAVPRRRLAACGLPRGLPRGLPAAAHAAHCTAQLGGVDVHSAAAHFFSVNFLTCAVLVLCLRPDKLLCLRPAAPHPTPAGPAPPAPAPQPPPSCCSFALPRSSQLLPCAPRSRSRSLAMSAEAKYREGMAALERAGKAYAAAPRAHALARGLMQVTHIPLLSAAQARTGRRQRLQRPLQKARLRDRGRRVQQGRSVANPCRPSAPHARACSADRTQPPDVAAGTSRASPRHVLPQRQVVRTGQAGLPQG